MICPNARLLAGNAHPALARAIAENLGVPLLDAKISRFSDGEIRVEIYENLRGKDVFLLQPTCPPVNENLMELLIMADAVRRASASSLTAVMPYFGYARQERKSASRSPISAKLVADMLTSAGVDRVLSLELHAAQIQGFFNIPVDNLYAEPVLVDDMRQHYNSPDSVIVSPDVGGVVRVRSLAKVLDKPIAIIDKRRPAPNETAVMHVIGDVQGKTCILYDDMIDTAGTITAAAEALLTRGGAKRVVAYAAHGVLSGPALERLQASSLAEIVVTDTIPQAAHQQVCSKLRIVSSAPLLAEAIRRITTDASLSALFHALPNS